MAAVFAVEALTAEENAEYVEHLGVCDVCRRMAGHFQQAAGVLPDMLVVDAPSPDLKQRVLAQARSDVERFAPPVSSTPLSEARRPSKWRWPAWFSPAPATAIAVLAMAVIGLLVWNVALRQEVDQQRVALLQHQVAIDALAAGGLVVHIPATEAAPQAAGVLVQEPGTERAILIVSGLPSLPPDMGYQLWRVRDESATPVGAGTLSAVYSDVSAVVFSPTFSIANTGAHLVIVSTTFSDPDAIGVSVEPVGGSAAPTGDIVLLGKL